MVFIESVWSAETNSNSHPCLDGDKSTDVLIIGGGMAGVLCAHMLHEAGADYCLIEAETVGSGVTKNTTAKITSQHGFIYSRLMRQFGFAKTKLYYTANEEALAKYRDMCRGIECDFENRDSYVYSTKSVLSVHAEMNALRKIGADASSVEKLDIPVNTVGAVKFKNQAQFNPLKFLYAVSEKLNIYEHTRLLHMDGMTAVTDRGRIKAERVIYATHFPLTGMRGLYFLKLYQHRSYVLALEGTPQPDGMYVDEDENGLSFRSYGGLLLLGGGSHRTGKSGGGFDELRAFAAINYNRCTEKYYWATQDCMSLDGVPYIGRASQSMPNVYVATGFNKWGMTSSMASALLLCDLLQGKRNKYEALFSPSRSMLHFQLAANIAQSTLGLLSPFGKRCTHMGCKLKWNKQEHTWDCPCHGSRYAKDGHLLDNPAEKNLR